MTLCIVQKAYPALFDLHGNDAWKLSNDDLITFFRQSDQTSATIGGRQASTFKVLAGLSGHGDLPESKPKKAAKDSKQVKPNKTPNIPAPKPAAVVHPHGTQAGGGNQTLGLTVRVEINLPADGSKETYDAIFKSIKENLLSG